MSKDGKHNHSHKHKRMGFGLAAVALGMVGMAYASVPLYELFCRVTGFGGTTQVAAGMPVAASERSIKVRFNADVSSRLAWRFRPMQREVELKLGEGGLSFYEAVNTSGIAREGVATYNVTPQKAGKYFNKIACFCFDTQRLEPGERVEMPVTYFVDPAIHDDPNTRDVKTITLSYTFFPADDIDESAGSVDEIAVVTTDDD